MREHQIVRWEEGQEEAPHAMVIWPVTLREVEKADVELAGQFGHDDAEHAELLDNQTILRAVYEYWSDGCIQDAADGEWYSARGQYHVEVYQARLGHEAGWESCMAHYRDPSGSRERSMYEWNEIRVRDLIGDWRERYPVENEIEQPIDDWVKAANAAMLELYPPEPAEDEEAE